MAKRIAIVGGGAAGFFCAIRLKEMLADADITIFERQSRPLKKVEVSGGGRCNLTNTFEGVADLRQVYPRGHRLLKRLFKEFGPDDAFRWFTEHGVPLTIQPDHCVFPEAQDSHAVIDCFLRQCNRCGIHLHLNSRIQQPEDLLSDFDSVVVTIGGTPRAEGCVPSLFTFNIKDSQLNQLMGVVVEGAIASIPGTKFKAQGALLLTHWGMSGPAILKLSSYAARFLAETNYSAPLTINWLGEENCDVVAGMVQDAIEQNPSRLVGNIRVGGLQQSLWNYLLGKIGISERRCNELGKKNLNRIVNLLTNDQYTIAGRCHYKDEFVTCGGIPLDAVDARTLESKTTPRLYYAGEVLDIDGITGGFNFQAAWTTADAVARAIVQQMQACNALL